MRLLSRRRQVRTEKIKKESNEKKKGHTIDGATKTTTKRQQKKPTSWAPFTTLSLSFF